MKLEKSDADKIFDFIKNNYEFEVLGEPANLRFKCTSFTISRNRQLHIVILEQGCKRGRGGEIQRLEKKKWDSKIKKKV